MRQAATLRLRTVSGTLLLLRHLAATVSATHPATVSPATTTWATIFKPQFEGPYGLRMRQFSFQRNRNSTLSVAQPYNVVLRPQHFSDYGSFRSVCTLAPYLILQPYYRHNFHLPWQNGAIRGSKERPRTPLQHALISKSLGLLLGFSTLRTLYWASEMPLHHLPTLV